MNEQILKALMQLFAIIARPDSNREDRRVIVESFLTRLLNQSLAKEYLKEFDRFYVLYQNKQKKKERGMQNIASFSVKVLLICTEINKALQQNQKFIVLIQLLEFVKSDTSRITRQEMEFIDMVADIFHIPKEEYSRIRDFALSPSDKLPEFPGLLIISQLDNPTAKKSKFMKSAGLVGEIRIMHVSSTNMYFMSCEGTQEISLNGQLIDNHKIYTFTTGSVIRNKQIQPLYYSDIASRFAEDSIQSGIDFEVREIDYQFKNGGYGLQEMSFSCNSGQLIGIMGASGAGKSTLLNVLNGTCAPGNGSVKINGIDIYQNSGEIKGIIGHVSQDDLLIEELTVFQNLYYNALLCFDNFSKEEVRKKTLQTLKNLGLLEIKDIQVGSPLNKKISGGQRKRLNIALELIREPSVLFLDEPTSGLSSRDSEIILDLLKELTLRGKLVFVVIHQPSSDIFKMFDRLLILDTGGYLIYNGNPVESIVYFKERVQLANRTESECQTCGNVNPEQIFNIVESAVIDEYGMPTDTRKISPPEWRHWYLQKHENDISEKSEKKQNLPAISFKIPGRIKQFLVFVRRDIHKKLSDLQYLLVNFLEAPVLAFLLAWIIKYFDVDVNNKFGYTLFGNDNLPVYIFMSVIVAIFMGLTVSAEEIIKDRKILKREAFLNLSWSGYLFSKVSVQFILSAIQAASFVIIGNSILEIKGMYFIYWLVLFSAWAGSNLLGLLISDSFRTVVTIYILIPFLVIPQIVLSGIIVSYDDLNPKISNPKTIPFYGEMITARWAYEALATWQFMENDYQKRYYDKEKLLRNASFKENFLLQDLLNKVSYLEKHMDETAQQDEINYRINLLRNEIQKEHRFRLSLAQEHEGVYTEVFSLLNRMNAEEFNAEVNAELKVYLQKLQKFYSRVYKNVYNSLNEQKRSEDENFIEELKRSHHNESLEEFVTNKNEFKRITEYRGELIQKKDPIYLDPESSFIRAHFYAPGKSLFGSFVPTIWVNLMVLWTLTIILFILLYFRILKRSIELFDNIKVKSKQIISGKSARKRD